MLPADAANLELISALAALNIKLKRGVLGAACTTFGIGGSIDCLCEPENMAELQACVQILDSFKVKPLILGAGSNLLLPDQGLKRPVIRLGQGFRTLELHGNKLAVGGAFSLMNLARSCAAAGLSGL